MRGWATAPRQQVRITETFASALRQTVLSHVGLVQVQVDRGDWQGVPAGRRGRLQWREQGVLGAAVLAEPQQGVAAGQEGRRLLVPGALSRPGRPRRGRQERGWRWRRQQRRGRPRGGGRAQHRERRGEGRGGAG